MSKIPKIIHHTSKDFDIPDYLADLINTWKIFHQNWEFKFWTDAISDCVYKKKFW